ncbi:MAG: hypothetical protein QXE06_01250 [Candidatus Bathyarchaeia archaeon]
MKRTLTFTVLFLSLALALYTNNNLAQPPRVFALEPSIESCDSAGNTVNTFNVGDAVYVKGSGLEPGGTYNIYIVQDYSPWTPSETHISDLYVVVGPITVDVDAEGNLENQSVLIWESASVGQYDIWADSQTDGEIGFYDECDAVDKLGVEATGFIVIPELLLITIPLLFAYITIITIKQRKTFKTNSPTFFDNFNYLTEHNQDDVIGQSIIKENHSLNISEKSVQ